MKQATCLQRARESELGFSDLQSQKIPFGLIVLNET